MPQANVSNIQAKSRRCYITSDIQVFAANRPPNISNNYLFSTFNSIDFFILRHGISDTPGITWEHVIRHAATKKGSRHLYFKISRACQMGFFLFLCLPSKQLHCVMLCWTILTIFLHPSLTNNGQLKSIVLLVFIFCFQPDLHGSPGTGRGGSVM